MSVNLSKFEFSSKTSISDDNGTISKRVTRGRSRLYSPDSLRFRKSLSRMPTSRLENMLKFEEVLGNPHKSLRTIHVAGTNGKGSVANMLASALSACGLRVGLYTSPHIVDFRERMRIVGENRAPDWSPRNMSMISSAVTRPIWMP